MIPDHLRESINVRRKELGMPESVWSWFDERLILGHCVILDVSGGPTNVILRAARVPGQISSES